MQYKKIPKNYIEVILNRMFRLTPAHNRYERTFNDILNKFLIKENSEKISLSEMTIAQKAKIASDIFNNSFEYHPYDDFLNNLLKREEDRIFKENAISKIYLKEKLHLTNAFLSMDNKECTKENLRWILNLIETKAEITQQRKKNRLLYPVEKIILTEGVTEEILLGKFSRICGYDFKENGAYIIPAGGKNQVARKYYEMIEEFQLPIFILLDSDATETKELINPKLRKKDEIYIIKKGEFEDIVPIKIIINSLNKRFKNDHKCSVKDFQKGTPATKNLYELFKQNGFGEFKKSEFAKTIADYISSTGIKKDNLSEEIIEISHKISIL